MPTAIIPIVLCAGIFSVHARAEVYRIGLRYLPTKISPRRNQINTDHYILLHLYYPLFYQIENGELRSEFLDMKSTRALDNTFTSFQMCLQDGLKFSDGEKIQVKDLIASLEQFHKVQESVPASKKIRAEGSCIKVNLARSDTRYFHKLVGVASTLLKAETAENEFPIGLGPYKIVSHTISKIELTEIPGRVTGDFERVSFLKWNDKSDLELDDRNHIYPRPFTQIDGTLQKIRTPTFKAYAIVLNFPDARTRKALASCLDENAIRKVVRRALVPSPGFLPSGLMGSNVNYSDIKKGFGRCPKRINGEFKLYVLLKEEVASIRKLLSQANSALERHLKVDYVPSSALARIIFDRNPKAVILGFDSSGSAGGLSRESSTFFESFIREDRLIATPPQGLKELVRGATQSNNEQLKKDLYSKAHRVLLESGYIVPLGQGDSVQYYPSNIQNIEWADRISGFPAIHKMKRAKE